jgi:hypothetical protein
MNEVIMPTIGRIVQVTVKDDINGLKHTFPGIITNVHTEELISVAVFMDYETRHYTSVYNVNNKRESYGLVSWDWLQFQKDQLRRP